MDDDDVIKKLQSFGSKVGEFRQQHALSRLSTDLSAAVAGGFCTGVCVDWARRVLLADAAKQQQKSLFTNKGAERQAYQAERQANFQTAVKGFTNFRNDVVDVQEDLADAFNPHAAAGSPVPISPKLQTALQKYIKFTPRADRTYTCASVDNWLKLLKQLMDRNDYKTSPGWAALVGVMDGYDVNQRKLQSRTASKRPFSHIKIRDSAPDKQYLFVKDALKELIADIAWFVPASVLMLKFGLMNKGKSAAHTVAVHRVDNSVYRFLDPNYGVFEYNLINLIKAFAYLFSTLDGGPVYGQGGDKVTGRVGYILFERA